LLLADLLFEHNFADMSEIAVFLVGIYSFEQLTSIDYILEFNEPQFSLIEPKRTKHSVYIIHDSMTK
jgi:hypothetical protein